MDRLFTLSSNSSELSQDYFPPIELEKGSTYTLGLYSLNTFNSVPNVISNQNDLFYYYIINKGNIYVSRNVRIPEGAYEIDALEKLLYDLVFWHLFQ